GTSSRAGRPLAGHSFALRNQHGEVVSLFVRAELANMLEQRSQQVLRRKVAVAAQGFHQTRFAEFFAIRVEGLGDAVGVEDQCVSGKEIPLPRAAIPTFEEPQHRARRIKPFQLAVAAEQQRGKVAAVRIAQATLSVAIFAKKERRKGALLGVLVKESMDREQEALRLFKNERDTRRGGITRRLIAKMGL